MRIDQAGKESHVPQVDDSRIPGYGQSGTDVSELLPEIAGIVDDLCVIRSMHTGHNGHEVSIRYFHGGVAGITGRPTLGSWIVYGLGSEADDLPGLIAAFNGRQEMRAAWQTRDPAAPWAKNWWFADAGVIEREDWNLSASRYRPETREATEHRDPRDLLEELREDVETILGDIQALAADLRGEAA